MTRDQHGPLIPWATHVLQWRIQWVAKSRDGANPIKVRPSSDWSLQLDSMKSESLVIADQLCRGEYVLELCTRVLCSRVCQPRTKSFQKTLVWVAAPCQIHCALIEKMSLVWIWYGASRLKSGRDFAEVAKRNRSPSRGDPQDEGRKYAFHSLNIR